jgi:hypothetical protein
MFNKFKKHMIGFERSKAQLSEEAQNQKKKYLERISKKSRCKTANPESEETPDSPKHSRLSRHDASFIVRFILSLTFKPLNIEDHFDDGACAKALSGGSFYYYQCYESMQGHRGTIRLNIVKLWRRVGNNIGRLRSQLRIKLIKSKNYLQRLVRRSEPKVVPEVDQSMTWMMLLQSSKEMAANKGYTFYFPEACLWDHRMGRCKVPMLAHLDRQSVASYGAVIRLKSPAERYSDLAYVPDFFFVKYDKKAENRPWPDEAWRTYANFRRPDHLFDLNAYFDECRKVSSGNTMVHADVRCLFDTKWPLHVVVWDKRLDSRYYDWGRTKPLVQTKVGPLAQPKAWHPRNRDSPFRLLHDG